LWLQDDDAMPISEAVLQSIKAIDWNSHAFDFEYQPDGEQERSVSAKTGHSLMILSGLMPL
jgi:hypothetical protein